MPDHGPWSPRDERLTPTGFEPVPAWVAEYREHQWDAAVEVCEHIHNGAGLVFVDAPTGSGKTLLADLISRMLGQHAVYLCTTKSLQDQVLKDFDYARTIKGRDNYRTMMGGSEVTCGDCQGPRSCVYCKPVFQCPYRVAKAEAIRSQLAVANMAYWLREANYVSDPAFSIPPDASKPEGGGGRRRREGGLFIIDECDTLEDQLLGFIEFSVSARRARELRINAPKKGVHKATLAKWMKDDLMPALDRASKEYADSTDLNDVRRSRAFRMQYDQTNDLLGEVEDENWLRDYEREDMNAFSMKPVKVEGYGTRYIWRHGGRFVLMSATIISPEEMVQTLGYEGEYATVRVPMTFPVENRPIHIAGVANMTWKTEPEELPKAITACQRIIEMHPDVKVLIHTVSYGRAQKMMVELRARLPKRKFFTYKNAKEREDALKRFRAHDNGVMLAPSFERGIDLADDDCRVQIVVKMPYPNISDPRVNARSHGPDGEAWMAVQTIRSLVQMTGRAVRSADDWCVTYILDQQFNTRVWKRNKDLIPAWWSESVNRQFRVRELM